MDQRTYKIVDGMLIPSMIPSSGDLIEVNADQSYYSHIVGENGALVNPKVSLLDSLAFGFDGKCILFQIHKTHNPKIGRLVKIGSSPIQKGLGSYTGSQKLSLDRKNNNRISKEKF